VMATVATLSFRSCRFSASHEVSDMFVDLPGSWPPEDPQPDPRQRRLSVREQKVLIWLLGVNVLLLLIVPIGGATLVQFLVGIH